MRPSRLEPESVQPGFEIPTTMEFLRQSTEELHKRVELAFNLQEALGSKHTYVKLLGRLNSFYVLMEHELQPFARSIRNHHYEAPRLVSYQARAAAEFVGIVCSMQIAAKVAQDDSEYRHRLDQAQGRLLTQLSTSDTVASGLRDRGEDVLELCNATGAAIVIATSFT
jgi:hypothetical protein